jgi:hypothetical protein
VADSVYALLLHKRQSVANYAFLTAKLDTAITRLSTARYNEAIMNPETTEIFVEHKSRNHEERMRANLAHVNFLFW